MNNISQTEIKNKITKLGQCLMRKNSHGFKNSEEKILDAAKDQIKKLEAKKNAAIAIIGIVLGANRKWETQVKCHIEKLKKIHPNLTFNDLQIKFAEMDWKQFQQFWGHRDEKKYYALVNLVSQILEYSKKNPGINDLDLMKQWVREFDLEMLHPKNSQYKNYPGSVPNLGIATFQHLRLTFGIDTVKPDQRVREVLCKEFGMKLSAKNAILAVEEIAEITGEKVKMIDQIFVKYGSGYY